MRILIAKVVPGEIKAKHMTYNIQEIGLAVALRKKGHICDVMSISDDNKFRQDEVNINGVNLTLYSVKAIVALKNGWPKGVYSIFDKYDIIQVPEYNQIFTWHVAKKYKDKMVCYHGPYYCSFNHNYNLMAKFFDLFFVNRYKKLNTCFITKSGLAKDYLEGKGLKNVHAVGVGLGTSFLSDKISDESLPEIEKIKSFSCLKLLYIGVIEPRRNSLFLLDVLSELKNKGIDFKMIIVGRYKDNEYESKFRSKIEELSLDKYIYHIPRLEQRYLSQIYKNSDIFLFPTIYDIYGMVLLEAMYFGLPTITSLNGGSQMMVKNGLNGILLDSFDPKVWADAVYNLSQDSQMAKELSAAAHITIEERFTWEALADKFIEIYEMKLNHQI